MRKRTKAGAWIAAVLGTAAFAVPSTTTGTMAANATPVPMSTPPSTCSNTPAPDPDPANIPPTAPGTPEVVMNIMNMARLRWTPATDPDGVIACYLVRENLADGSVTTRAVFQPTVTEGDVVLPWPPSGVPSVEHELYIVAVDSKGAVGPPSGTVIVKSYNDIVPVPSPTPSPPPQPTCRVEASSSTWGDGMTTNIAITNTGTTTVNDWKLTFSFPDSGQKVTSGWSATWTQTGSTVTATGMPWNKDLAPGQTLWIGFNGTHNGANPTPTTFQLNGTSCA